jgi:hypothetical protein
VAKKKKTVHRILFFKKIFIVSIQLYALFSDIVYLYLFLDQFYQDLFILSVLVRNKLCFVVFKCLLFIFFSSFLLSLILFSRSFSNLLSWIFYSLVFSLSCFLVIIANDRNVFWTSFIIHRFWFVECSLLFTSKYFNIFLLSWSVAQW